MIMGTAGLTNTKVKKKVPFRTVLWNQRWLVFFTLPGFLFYLIYAYTPMLGIVMAFQEFDPTLGFFRSTFIGFDNFKFVFAMPEFLMALRNSVVISVLKFCIGFPLGIVFALMINEIANMKFKRVTQTITYLPYFISWVTVAGLFYKMLAIDGGLVNELLMKIGFTSEPIMFMGENKFFWPIVILTDQWKNIGFGAIIYLAALAGINPELYEAAVVDGAGRFRRIWHISLPGIRNTIVLLLILSISGLISAGFDQMWTLGNISIRDTSEILDTLVLRMLNTAGLYSGGWIASMGLFTSVIGFLLFFTANKLAAALKQESLI